MHRQIIIAIYTFPYFFACLTAAAHYSTLNYIVGEKCCNWEEQSTVKEQQSTGEEDSTGEEESKGEQTAQRRLCRDLPAQCPWRV